jgi:long-chain acyl-CoA synthetase
MADHGTLAWPLRRALQLRRHEVAVIDGERRLTYEQLADRLTGLPVGLRSLGLHTGDRIAGLFVNSYRHLELWLGVPAAGMVVTDLNIRLAPSELEFIIGDSGARVLVTDRRHWQTAEALLARCPDLERLIWADDGSPPTPDAIAWDDLCAAAPPPTSGGSDDEVPSDPERVGDGADLLAAISYTGGTTGHPKGVMQTHGNLLANAKHTMLQNPLTSEDRFLHSSPMFHAAGVANIYGLTWVAGTHVIAPGFDAENVGRIIEEQRVTVAVLVPTMLNMFLAHPTTATRDLSSWRLLIYAASPIPVELLRRALDALPCEFAQAYGMTEASPHVAGSPPRAHRLALAGDPAAVARLASCGPASVGIDVEVRRDDGTVCAVDEIGEIVLRGPNVMSGYWNRPEETAAAFTPDGFYRSGDLAWMDEGGYLFIVDRSKDMIISGGENIYTTEVESALHEHPAVIEVAVFGIPDERWGEIVHAEVVVASGTEVDGTELVDACREHIAGFKVPRSINLSTEPLPKSGAGKILKRELRQRYRPD